jgi:hypothetical protein
MYPTQVFQALLYLMNLLIHPMDKKEILFTFSSYIKGLNYTDNGWTPRTVFIANSNPKQPVTFTYAYMNANFFKLSTIFIISFITIQAIHIL